MLNSISGIQFSGGYSQAQLGRIKLKECLKERNFDVLLEVFDLPMTESPLFTKEWDGFGHYHEKNADYKKALEYLIDLVKSSETPQVKIVDLDKLLRNGKPVSLDVNEQLFDAMC